MPSIIFLDEILPKNIKYISKMYIIKEDVRSVLKALSYNLASSKVEVKDISKNRVDFDILNKSTEDMINLRKEIQLNNEEVYKVYHFVTVTSDTIEELRDNINKIRNILYSKNIKTIKLNFRNLEGYLSTVLTENVHNYLNKYVNVLTTSNVTNLFPFYTKSILDSEGILFGKTSDNGVLLIDLFSNKYLNSNICVFGSSGSGKSFFTKSIILRNNNIGVKGFIFDVENEYSNVVKSCEGTIINCNSYDFSYNILQIRKYDLKSNNFIDSKISNIVEYIAILIIDELLVNEKVILIDFLKKLYLDFKINENIESVYKDNKLYLEKTIKDESEFPTIKNLIKLLEDVKQCNNKQNIKSLILKLKYIEKYFPFFCNKSTFNIDSELISFNLSNMDSLKLQLTSIVLLNEISMLIEKNKEKTIIYIDEFWKLISNNILLKEKILELFKTIRKNNAGIMVITQDINDIFMQNFGKLGESIINNSAFSLFFKMQYSDKDNLFKAGIINENLVNKINLLAKGNCVLCFDSNIIEMKAITRNREKLIIEGGSNDNNSN